MRSDYKAAPNQQQLPLSFYLTFGYFPRSMDEALDFYHREIQPDESKEHSQSTTEYCKIRFQEIVVKYNTSPFMITKQRNLYPSFY